MAPKSRRMKLILAVGTGVLAIGGVLAYAGIPVIQGMGISDHIGLANGPATLVARKLTTPVGETTGGWHYHPGYVYDVVAAGTITVEDGCGEVNHYTAGQAFETSEGRVHRAYNLGDVDAVEYNMFVNRGASNATVITKSIPNNERRCGPPSTIHECLRDGWTKFDWPNPFANQGQCIAFVIRRPRIMLLVPTDPLP